MSISIVDIFKSYKGQADGDYNSVVTEYANLDIEWVVKTGSQTISADTSWGNATNDARNLLVLVKGNLTVNSGCTLTATARKRGMFIWVNGNLTLNGTISMSARGASAAGARLLLCNISSNYEVPAAGGAGAPTNNSGGHQGNYSQNGVAGTSGVATGACGGGGSGGCATASGSDWAGADGGAGAQGTSYSGGSGGGGATARKDVGTGGSASANGGAGGAGGAYNPVDRNTMNSGGGAGNPGGVGNYAGDNNGSREAGANGTGGLLVIFVTGTLTFGGSGKLEAKGCNGGNVTGNASNQAIAGGAGSGGGHIDIFYKTLSGSAVYDVSGGAGGTRSGTYGAGANGGAGGAGSARATQVALPNLFGSNFWAFF